MLVLKGDRFVDPLRGSCEAGEVVRDRLRLGEMWLVLSWDFLMADAAELQVSAAEEMTVTWNPRHEVARWVRLGCRCPPMQGKQLRWLREFRLDVIP